MPDYNYLNLLNEQQRAAVEYCSGPQLVIAGAGSGKTRVLTYKIVHLLAHGYDPSRIMALTFTNKAAGEMKERIAQLLGWTVARKLVMGTFHSVFLRILREHADKLGFRSSFTIYDASDSKALVKSIISEMGLDDKVYRPGTVAAIISNAKNDLVTPEIYAGDQDRLNCDYQSGRADIYRIYEEYQRRCNAAQAMDFDDILVFMNILLRDFPKVREHYRQHFQYILVDEYQDTNFAQDLSVSLLCNGEQRLCVVGDDAQSIYSFRGANIDNILTLGKRYPDLRTDKLEQNYRSTQNIINAAGSLIEKNRRQLKKNIFSRNGEGSKVELIRAYSDLEEARAIAQKIMTMRSTFHDSYDDYAILYRTNAQSRAFEEELRRLAIGYRIHGGISFYQRKEVKTAVCYFRLAINPDDDQALLRVINTPARGIGKTTLDKLKNAAHKNDVSLWTVLTDRERYPLDINKGTARKLDGFVDIVQAIREENENPKGNAYTVAQVAYNRSELLVSLAHDKTPETISQKENLNELIAGAKAFVERVMAEGGDNVSMSAFLSEVALATDFDREETEVSESGKVTMMTAHASKGLEYKHVFIVGMEEDLFPAALSAASERGLEEERRLLYVAMTRAMETCTLSYANSRFRNGQTLQQAPSRFLYDIDRSLLDTGCGKLSRSEAPRTSRESRYIRKPKPERAPVFTIQEPVTKINLGDASGPGNAVKHSADELNEGMKIRHTHFGTGTIMDIDREVQSIRVDFGGSGVKKLMLGFATFEILK